MIATHNDSVVLQPLAVVRQRLWSLQQLQQPSGSDSLRCLLSALSALPARGIRVVVCLARASLSRLALVCLVRVPCPRSLVCLARSPLVPRSQPERDSLNRTRIKLSRTWLGLSIWLRPRKNCASSHPRVVCLAHTCTNHCIHTCTRTYTHDIRHTRDTCTCSTT